MPRAGTAGKLGEIVSIELLVLIVLAAPDWEHNYSDCGEKK
jgi:hypothetical protein